MPPKGPATSGPNPVLVGVVLFLLFVGVSLYILFPPTTNNVRTPSSSGVPAADAAVDAASLDAGADAEVDSAPTTRRIRRHRRRAPRKHITKIR